jgi:AcrR family transcriptional regulator
MPTRRRQETRARLLDAAFAVFAARGFGAARIEEVCEAAGYTRGAFYSNFASLEELFFELYEQRAGALADQVAVALADGGGTVPELVERVVDALRVDRDWLLVRTDFQLHAARHPAVAHALAAHRDAVLASLVGPLAAVLDPAALPPALGTVERVARAVVTVHDAAMAELLLDPDPVAARRWLTDLLTALLFAGGPAGQESRASSEGE